MSASKPARTSAHAASVSSGVGIGAAGEEEGARAGRTARCLASGSGLLVASETDVTARRRDAELSSSGHQFRARAAACDARPVMSDDADDVAAKEAAALFKIHGVDQRSPSLSFEHAALGDGVVVAVRQDGSTSRSFLPGTSTVIWPCAYTLADILCDATAAWRRKREEEECASVRRRRRRRRGRDRRGDRRAR